MTIERFEPMRHLPLIQGWYKERGMDPVNPSGLPEIGIVTDRVCAGFLWQTDSSVCIAGGVISDPKAPPKKLEKALRWCIESLYRHGYELGFREVTAYTRLASVEARAKEFGAVATPGFVELNAPLMRTEVLRYG
jgi:hypothetical protein